MRRMFDSLPTIDAVPVVRCKDCKWVDVVCKGKYFCSHPFYGLFSGVKPNTFCSYGETKEAAHEVSE